MTPLEITLTLIVAALIVAVLYFRKERDKYRYYAGRFIAESVELINTVIELELDLRRKGLLTDRSLFDGTNITVTTSNEDTDPCATTATTTSDSTTRH
jgi:hypothetical protein